MKKILFFLTIVISIAVFSSFNYKDNKTLFLYTECIKRHIQNQKEDTINILQNDIILLPSFIGKHFLREIEYNNQDFFSAKKSVYVLKILPIQIESEYLVITLSDYVATAKNNNTALSYTGGEKYYFKYNCSTRNYTFFKSVVVSF